MARDVELVFYSGDTLLESPCWDSLNNIIYCVSIEQNRVYQINPQNCCVKTFDTAGPVGCVVVEPDGNLLEAEYSGIYRLNSQNGKKTFIVNPNSDKDMRYNDGKLDPKGRFIVGTKGLNKDYKNRGKLFSFDGNDVKILEESITISNGIAFSSDASTMYFVDTPTKKIAKYKYDVQNGTASFENYIYEMTNGAFPDGMCIDKDDNIWVAEWNGSKVIKINTHTGTKTDEIILPCLNVTSCCFGGKNLEYLYITTAKSDKEEPSAGGLFRVKL